VENLSNIIGNSSIASFIYYLGATVVAVFLAGFYISNKLRKICAEDAAELGNKMTEMDARLTTLEKEAITTTIYERDIKAVRDLVTEIRADVREGFAGIAARVDTLFAFKAKE
jgi:hypothetical protein